MSCQILLNDLRLLSQKVGNRSPKTFGLDEFNSVIYPVIEFLKNNCTHDYDDKKTHLELINELEELLQKCCLKKSANLIGVNCTCSRPAL